MKKNLGKKRDIKKRMLEFFNNKDNNISKMLERYLCVCCYFLPLIDIINGFSEELFSTAGWITAYNTYVFPFLFIWIGEKQTQLHEKTLKEDLENKMKKTEINKK